MDNPTIRQYDGNVSESPLVIPYFRLAKLFRRELGARLADERWVGEARLRPPCFHVLSCIEALQPVSQKRVSDELELDPSDLVAVLDILQEAGYIRRQRDPSDRRRHALTLTPDGRRASLRFSQIAAAAEASMLAPLDERERQFLTEVMRRLVDHHAAPARVAVAQE